MKRTREEYIEWLEQIAAARPDVVMCDECDELYPRKETERRGSRFLCDHHAEYADQCEREDEETAEAKYDMREHGHAGQFFSVVK